MTFTGDDRGQSIQIGAVLLFGFLIIGLTIYQATVVPQQNSQVEYSHSLAVQEDLQQLRNSVVRITAGGEPLPQTVALGTTYPTRIVAINPGPPSGTLATTGQFDVNVAGVDQSVCPGQSSPAGAQSRLLTYRDGYNEYAQAPLLVYENTVVHKQFVDPDTASSAELERGTIPMSGQRLVDGNRIHLLAIVGNYEEGGAGVATVEPRAGETRRTAVTDPVLTLPTRMNASEWGALLAGTGADVSLQSGYNPVGAVRVQFTGQYVLTCTPVSFTSHPATSPGPQKQGQSVTMTNPWGNITNGAMQFSIRNSAGTQATVSGFSLTSGFVEEIRASGTTNEVEVDPSPSGPSRGRTAVGNIAAGPQGSGFDDQTAYDFIEDSDSGGQTGVLFGNQGATVVIRGLRDGNGNAVRDRELRRTPNPQDAIVAVTLRFSDGSEKTFYFEEWTRGP